MVGLCLQSRLHHALPDLLSQVLANLYHVQEVAVPMKHRSWSDVITKEMVALGNCRKPMPPKPYEGRSDLTLWDKATQFPPAMPDSFAQGLHQRVPVTIVSLMQH